MVKMKIIAGRTEAKYGEGIPSGATRFKWYRVGKCSFTIFKNTLVDSSLQNFTESNMNQKLIPEDMQSTACLRLLAC